MEEAAFRWIIPKFLTLGHWIPSTYCIRRQPLTLASQILTQKTTEEIRIQ